MRARISTIVAVILGVSLMLGCQSSGTRAADQGRAVETGKVAAAPQVTARGMIEPSPFVGVAEKVMPAVVSIDTKRKVDTGSEPQFEEPFGQLFRNLIPNYQQPREYEVPGYASGFIFDKRGYVVTNNHVIQDAEEIVVRLIDGNEYKGTVVGSDPNTDIAIVKIDTKGEPAVVNIGDSDAIKVGDWAIAVGNPFGRLEGTVTVGVISAKGRSALNIVGGAPALQDFIQTDASINFGNSGGPLVNINGDAIGMNTAINPLGQGIGFAIPINLVQHVADEIIKYGKVSWGYLGIFPQEITKDIADALSVDPKSGILVGSVVEDGPAAKAGVKTGDIILALNGDKVANVDQFRLKVAQAGVGKEVTLDIRRGDERKSVSVKLAERPTEVAQAGSPSKPKEDKLGLRVDDVQGAEGHEVAPSGVDKGVVVVAVEDGSPAADAGLAPGDVIQEVNHQQVSNLGSYSELVNKALGRKDKPVLFLVKRDTVNRFVAVKPRQD
ncbi:MAG TPA: Do family serine endopeptidase [bacterium]|nr:Do family serine endopeptidase [bacterium]